MLQKIRGLYMFAAHWLKNVEILIWRPKKIFVSLDFLTKTAHVRGSTNKFTCLGLHEHGLFLLKTFKDINNHIFLGVRFSISSFLVSKLKTYNSREFLLQHLDKLQFGNI